jgi:hypothetical protein
MSNTPLMKLRLSLVWVWDLVSHLLQEKRIITLYFYSRIATTKFPSFCVTDFRASLTNFTVLLTQSHDSSYYTRRWTVVLPPLKLQTYTDIRDISLGSRTLPAPQARNFAESILLYTDSNTSVETARAWDLVIPELTATCFPPPSNSLSPFACPCGLSRHCGRSKGKC